MSAGKNSFWFSKEQLANVSESSKRANPGLFAQRPAQNTPLTLPYAFPTPSARKPRNRRPPSGPEPEQAVRNVPVQPPRGKAAYPGRVRISVESVRKRLIDPDNLCPKYFVDCLRYARLIRDDTPEACEIVTTQRRVSPGEEEKTIITLTPLAG